MKSWAPFLKSNRKEKMSSNDFRSVSIYESRNDEFRKLPTKLILTLPRFIPQKINTEHIYQEFGSLSTLSMDSSDVKSSPPYSQLIVAPQIITSINTEYKFSNRLCSVSC